jgi:hypothetical protein
MATQTEQVHWLLLDYYYTLKLGILHRNLHRSRSIASEIKEIILDAEYLWVWATSQYEGKGRLKEQAGSKTPHVETEEN